MNTTPAGHPLLLASAATFVLDFAATLPGTVTQPTHEPLVRARLSTGLSLQFAANQGTGLSRAACEGRLRALGALLEGADYRTLDSRLRPDGMQFSLWSHPVQDDNHGDLQHQHGRQQHGGRRDARAAPLERAPR